VAIGAEIIVAWKLSLEFVSPTAVLILIR